MALLLLTKKRSVYGGGRIDSVWICELTGREGGKRDVSLRESAVARCEEIGSTASGILHERKSLGIKTYNMGLIQVNTDDLVSRNSKVRRRKISNVSPRSLHCRSTRPRRSASTWEAPWTSPTET